MEEIKGVYNSGVPSLAPETREEMSRALLSIAQSRLTNGPDYAARGRKPIFNKEEGEQLLVFLSTATDEEFLAFTQSFLEENGHSRRGLHGSRLVFAPSFMDDLREGLRDTYEPLDPIFLETQIQGYRQVLEATRKELPSFGVPLEEEDEKNLRQVVKKILEITRHLSTMLHHTESRGQSDLLVALIYKIQKLLDIPQTFAFAQMVLSALFELTEQFTLVENMYGNFKFEEFVSPYVETLQKRLETRSDAMQNVPTTV